MPTYCWGCENCGKVEEVLRPMAQIDQPPDKECCEDPDRKRIPASVSTSFGQNWTKKGWKNGGGGKGRWGKE